MKFTHNYESPPLPKEPDNAITKLNSRAETPQIEKEMKLQDMRNKGARPKHDESVNSQISDGNEEELKLPIITVENQDKDEKDT